MLDRRSLKEVRRSFRIPVSPLSSLEGAEPPVMLETELLQDRLQSKRQVNAQSTKSVCVCVCVCH